MQLSSISLALRQQLDGVTAYNPALLLDFTSGNQTIDPRITFTRSTTATYFNSAGVLTTTGFNLLTYSEQFDNAAWTKTRTTITADAAVSPDGTLDADKLVEDTGTGSHTVRNATSVTIISGATLTASVFAKAAEGAYVIVGIGDGGGINISRATFNLSTEEITNLTTPAANVSAPTAVITSVGNGWYRCAVTATVTGVTTAQQWVFKGSPTGTASYTGDGTSGIYLWGAQLEEGSAATAYIPTAAVTSGAARFDYDPVTLAPKGLLIEESRTNLLTYSEQFDNAAWTKSNATVTADAVVSPDGTMDGDKLVEDTATNSHLLTAAASSVVSGTAYTFSFYAKSDGSGRRIQAGFPNTGFGSTTRVNFNVDTQVVTPGTNATGAIISVGNGWYRCTATMTATVTASVGMFFALANTDAASFAAANYTGDGTSGIYIWGAQLEAGAFATSYIPTVASQVTRAADLAVMTGTNFSSWYNATEGTMFSEASTYDVSNARVGFGISDNTAPNRIQVGHGGGARLFISTGGVTQLTQTLASVTLFNNTASKIALAYKLNNGNGALKGTIGTLDTSVTIPTVTQAQIGGLTSTLLPLNGHVRRLAYYNRRLSDAELQGITS